MKPGLVEHLRCPACRAPLTLTIDDSAGDDVVTGSLACSGCAARFAIRDSVPRLLPPEKAEPIVRQTAETFGYGWAHGAVQPVTATIPWHYVKMQRALNLAPPSGMILDAGCGDGIDLANQALAAHDDVIGVDVSDGGVAQSWRRAGHLPRAHVVQADLRHLPFAEGMEENADRTDASGPERTGGAVGDKALLLRHCDDAFPLFRADTRRAHPPA